MAPLKKFKRKHKVIHRLIAFTCVVALFWGIWQILDALAIGKHASVVGAAVIVVSLIFLFLDDFHLKELE